MNQRDDRQSVDTGALLKFIVAAQAALEFAGEDDAALRFEILGDFIQQDVIMGGKPLVFSTKALGL